MINLTIDGRKIQAEAGMTILQAAQANGIEIPTLCYDPSLSKEGACRICVVEVEGARLLQAACVAPVYEGMVVHTNSEKVQKSRKINLELLWANHKHDCLTCEKAGECKLQSYAYKYGVAESRFEGKKKEIPLKDDNPFFVRDYTKCINCGKCIRVCQEVQINNTYAYVNRGFNAHPDTPFEISMADDESPCVFCGNCVAFCPTGALTSKVNRGEFRTWEVEKKVKTTCTYCGCGCGLELNVIGNKVVRVTPDKSGKTPNEHGALCVKGRFGFDFINREDRLTQPLIKENGEFRVATWDEALDLVASKFKGIAAENGGDSLMFLSSARTLNEENYLMQKLARAVFKTNNVDHCARL